MCSNHGGMGEPSFITCIQLTMINVIVFAFIFFNIIPCSVTVELAHH